MIVWQSVDDLHGSVPDSEAVVGVAVDDLDVERPLHFHRPDWSAPVVKLARWHWLAGLAVIF